MILSSILGAADLHRADRVILAAFARRVEKDRNVASRHDLSAVLRNEFAAVAHTRAFRLLNVTIAAENSGSENPVRLAALSFDGFQLASRQFVRALLPMLPLLGFLGTVIGLATAISELPRGLTEGAEHAFDISGSLGGLAVKFETTLLGLLASMISSLLLNFLEKREAELSAACMLIVKDAGEGNA